MTRGGHLGHLSGTKRSPLAFSWPHVCLIPYLRRLSCYHLSINSKLHLLLCHHSVFLLNSLPFFLTIKIMERGNNNLRLSHSLPFLLLLITFLMISPHLASCRGISRRSTEEGAQKSPAAEFYSKFAQRFPAKIPGARNREKEMNTDPTFGVSKRVVPGGPNPLHNWLRSSHPQLETAEIYKVLQFVAFCRKFFICVIDILKAKWQSIVLWRKTRL